MSSDNKSLGPTCSNISNPVGIVLCPPYNGTCLTLSQVVQMQIDRMKPIPRYPAGGYRHEPGYDSKGNMVEVSIVPAMIGDSNTPEKVLALSGDYTVHQTHKIAKVLKVLPDYLGDKTDLARSLVKLKTKEDAYDLAEKVINGTASKADRTRLQILRIYQRVRARYS